jgi:hypothetical protein
MSRLSTSSSRSKRMPSTEERLDEFERWQIVVDSWRLTVDRSLRIEEGDRGKLRSMILALRSDFQKLGEDMRAMVARIEEHVMDTNHLLAEVAAGVARMLKAHEEAAAHEKVAAHEEVSHGQDV